MLALFVDMLLNCFYILFLFHFISKGSRMHQQVEGNI